MTSLVINPMKMTHTHAYVQIPEASEKSLVSQRNLICVVLDINGNKSTLKINCFRMFKFYI